MNRYIPSNYISNNKAKSKSKLSIGYLLLIGIIVLLAIRAFSIINRYSESGGLPYVQLLNFSMPVVETQVYNEEAYVENKLTLKKVISETLGLSNISTYGIIGSEVSLFKNINIPQEVATNNIQSIFNPFKVSDESIAKVTEEEIAQLNQVSEAYDASLKPILEGKNLKVLIYHTHSHEGYAEIYDEQGEDTRYRSDNEDITVMGVGDVLTKELEESYGITVIHDKTIHDNDYNVCYDRSAETLQRYLSEYGDFDLIIDLHRDSQVNRDKMVANINGQNLARMMFVTADKSTNLEANTQLANALGDISDRLFPGLTRDLRILHYSPGGINGFNMSFSDNTVVWEVGSVANTSVEAKLTSRYMARIIAEYLKDK